MKERKPTAKVIVTKIGEDSYDIKTVYNENDSAGDLDDLFTQISLVALKKANIFTKKQMEETENVDDE